MSEKSPTEIEYKPLKIEEPLPTKAVGIECLKESNPETMSAHRYLHKWFARRPTAATRLAILSSILPQSVSNDELLNLMQIGPKNQDHLDVDLTDYIVEKWATKDDRSGSIGDHFGYELPLRQTPNEEKLSELHDVIREHWDGELPLVLDPTSGGGTIPMEAARYGLPTFANELNPVAWLINKVILDYAKEIGSLEEDVREWANEIDEYASEELSSYFPEVNTGQIPNHYFRTYSIECPSCGYRIPLTNRWWFRKDSSSEGHAIRPIVKEDEIEYEHVHVPSDVSTDEFDPSEGVIDSGDAECLNCGVVTEKDTLKGLFSNDEFEFEVCGVRYESKSSNGSGFRAATKEDKTAIKEAQNQIENDLRLSTLLSIERDIGSTDSIRVSWSYLYGMEEWRDVYSPRQLLAHATYLEGFEKVRPKIKEQYSEERAEAILVLLTLVSSKITNRNSRLCPIDVRQRGGGAPNSMLGTNNFAFQWQFGETNITTGAYSYQTTLDNIIEHYEEVVGYFDHNNLAASTVRQGDAASLPLEDNSVESVIIDPPYGDNIRYAELADSFYVWQREYLQEEFPEEFSSRHANKDDEAIQNKSRVSTSDSDKSKEDIAREKYEEKMENIFSEIYRVQEPGGVLTIYFTEKETDAWDSLTMSLINAGFTVSATHTVTSEMPQRAAMREAASADSTLLLTCRKPLEGNQLEDRSPTLWSDIQSYTREVAQKKATELLDANLNLTKTDTIISAFGPTLQVFTERFPVVDKHDNVVRPRRALEEARTAVTEVLVERELDESLDELDGLTTWYILTWLVYEKDTIPYDDANQLAIGVGIDIDDLKRDTKIWSKSKSKLTLKGQDYRVRDYDKLESGEKRRKRAYPVDPRETSFNYHIDAVHAALNVLETKGSDFTWNWISERNLQNKSWFQRTIKSLLQVLPGGHDDHEMLINLVSGKTGELLDIDLNSVTTNRHSGNDRTTLSDF